MFSLWVVKMRTKKKNLNIYQCHNLFSFIQTMPMEVNQILKKDKVQAFKNRAL